MDIDIDSNENNNFINSRKEESSIIQIKKRNKFYGDLTFLNESTYKTQVNDLPPSFCKSSTNLNENNELGNVNISNLAINHQIII